MYIELLDRHWQVIDSLPRQELFRQKDDKFKTQLTITRPVAPNRAVVAAVYLVKNDTIPWRVLRLNDGLLHFLDAPPPKAFKKSLWRWLHRPAPLPQAGHTHVALTTGDTLDLSITLAIL